MSSETSPSGIFEWITANTRPQPSDSATLRFERMESQAGHRLPEIHVPLDPRDPAHWRHRGFIWDFVLALRGAERVLDIGPGDGWPALCLAPHFPEVVGIEPGARRVEVCRANAKRMKRRNARFEAMSATEIDFPDASFGGVIACTSIEQTPDPPRALREAFRVLAPGGALRLAYEAYDDRPEPVSEAITLQRDPEREGGYRIDYVISWTARAEERGYLIEVVPASPAHAARLATWAGRCRDDAWPSRDPRLERGLASTVRELTRAEVRRARFYRLRHFKTAALLAALRRVGFTDIRLVLGGGWPAGEFAREMIQSRRIAAAAPLMEEMCRAAGRIGIAIETDRPGQVIARKPARAR
jgi:ubiquinone/menaquinone biosynthesis C-methylase UbiE